MKYNKEVAWLQDVRPEGWPVTEVTDEALRYTLLRPEGMQPQPDLISESVTSTRIYRGDAPDEWLTVSHMPQATGGQLRNWTEAVVQILGFPLEQVLTEFEAAPSLIEWQYLPEAQEEAARQYQADEAHLYTGLARWTSPAPLLSRIYQVLVRKGNSAWKVSLMFGSACLPGTPEELVRTNDHIRAGVTFGSLQLLS